MSKLTTADMLELDVRNLDEWGHTIPGVRGRVTWSRDRRFGEGSEQVASLTVVCTSKQQLRLVYTYGGDEDLNYPVTLDWTEPHFGGERPWFLCPAKGCGRRCAILYGGRLFLCRECHDLAYPRENKSGSRWKVARHNLYKVAEKLDVDTSEPMLMPWTPDRPKGMHQTTYADLLSEYRELHAEHERAVYADMVKLVEACGADVDLTDQQRALLEE